jgi:4-phospho-D-threonate 3-dehydrogenase / 4-phospho-D-erythronate 3-dehydrogenase
MKPRIALCVGDPAGVGPEIALSAVRDEKVQSQCEAVLFGPINILKRLDSLADIACHDTGTIDDAVFTPGKISAVCGRSAYNSFAAAVRAVLSKECDAVATAPLNKEALRASGCEEIGYTEMLASLCGRPAGQAVTMFDTLGLRIFFLTRHLSLANAVGAVRQKPLIDFIVRVSDLLEGLGVAGPIAVAGLNPHCGEHGLFGDEEQSEIAPAIETARARGIDVCGPIGADSVFHLAKEGRFSAVISLYHDQGHIAAKTLDFNRTVSFTLGLPVLRASVDHGTAFDIAWQRRADATSMKTTMLRLAKYLATKTLPRN